MTTKPEGDLVTLDLEAPVFARVFTCLLYTSDAADE